MKLQEILYPVLQPLVWPSNLLYVMLSGCDWWISIRSVNNNTQNWRKFWKRFRGCFVFQSRVSTKTVVSVTLFSKWETFFEKWHFCRFLPFFYVWHIFLPVTHFLSVTHFCRFSQFFKCYTFLQMWPIYVGLTHFSNRDTFFLPVTHFCKCEPLFYVWPIFSGVTRSLKWHPFSQLWHIFSCYLPGVFFATERPFIG